MDIVMAKTMESDSKITQEGTMRRSLLIGLLVALGFNEVMGQAAPSGYTTNFRLRKYVQGANPGADSLNQNWTDIDRAIRRPYWPDSTSTSLDPVEFFRYNDTLRVWIHRDLGASAFQFTAIELRARTWTGHPTSNHTATFSGLRAMNRGNDSTITFLQATGDGSVRAGGRRMQSNLLFPTGAVNDFWRWWNDSALFYIDGVEKLRLIDDGTNRTLRWQNPTASGATYNMFDFYRSADTVARVQAHLGGTTGTQPRLMMEVFGDRTKSDAATARMRATATQNTTYQAANWEVSVGGGGRILGAIGHQQTKGAGGGDIGFWIDSVKHRRGLTLPNGTSEYIEHIDIVNETPRYTFGLTPGTGDGLFYAGDSTWTTTVLSPADLTITPAGGNIIITGGTTSTLQIEAVSASRILKLARTATSTGEGYLGADNVYALIVEDGAFNDVFTLAQTSGNGNLLGTFTATGTGLHTFAGSIQSNAASDSIVAHATSGTALLKARGMTTTVSAVSMVHDDGRAWYFALRPASESNALKAYWSSAAGDKQWLQVDTSSTPATKFFGNLTIAKNSGGAAGSYPLLTVQDDYTAAGTASAGIILKRANALSTDFSVENYQGTFYIRSGVDLSDIGTGLNLFSLVPTTGDAVILGSLNIGAGSTLSKFVTASKTYNFGSIAAGDDSTTTVTATGAVAGNPVQIGYSVAPEAGLLLDAYCTANNVVTIRAHNANLVSAVDPASRTFKVIVTNF